MNRFTILAANAVILIMVLFGYSGWAQTIAGAQRRFYTENIKRIDSFNLFLKTYCDSVITVDVIDKAIKEDKKNIRYVSKLYNTAMSYKAFVQDAKKNDVVLSSSLRAGLINWNEYKFDAGYLAITVWLTVVDDRVIYKKFKIDNTSKRKCATDNAPIPFFDYVYLKKEIINDIDFPIDGCANCDSLIVDTLYQSLFNEMGQKYPAYKFIPDAASGQLKDLLFSATWLQASSYHNKEASELFIQLVKLKEYETITDLMFSPNHLLAVNAYEALVYLRRTRALEINSQTEEKMRSVAGSSMEIPVFCGRDCIPANSRYSTLKVSERQIYDKYEAALKENL